MEDRIYCYHCMTYHPAVQMRRVDTPRGPRWRCIRSIAGAANSTAERDAFGGRQTELNRLRARELQAIANPRTRSFGC